MLRKVQKCVLCPLLFVIRRQEIFDNNHKSLSPDSEGACNAPQQYRANRGEQGRDFCPNLASRRSEGYDDMKFLTLRIYLYHLKLSYSLYAIIDCR